MPFLIPHGYRRHWGLREKSSDESILSTISYSWNLLLLNFSQIIRLKYLSIFPPNSVIWPGIQLNTASAFELISLQVAISNRVMSRSSPTACYLLHVTVMRVISNGIQSKNLKVLLVRLGAFSCSDEAHCSSTSIFNWDFKGWNFLNCARTQCLRCLTDQRVGCVFRILNANSLSSSK